MKRHYLPAGRVFWLRRRLLGLLRGLLALTAVFCASYTIAGLRGTAQGTGTVPTPAALRTAESPFVLCAQDGCVAVVDPAVGENAVVTDIELATLRETDRRLIEAIYKWARYGFWYSGYSEKMDWKQAGYEMITTGYGDCFSFYGATKLMFERLRIPNIDVTRISNPYRTTSHYWSMVSIDGGETYYYFDSTPFAGVSYTFILATDADLDFFDSYICRGYFARDRSKLPATPTTKP